jgi:hypothetical protein
MRSGFHSVRRNEAKRREGGKEEERWEREEREKREERRGGTQLPNTLIGFRISFCEKEEVRRRRGRRREE